MKKHCDKVITISQVIEIQTSKPTRIDPELANEELMILFLAMEKKYSDVNQIETTTFQHAPPGRAPIMAAYNLESSAPDFFTSKHFQITPWNKTKTSKL